MKNSKRSSQNRKRNTSSRKTNKKSNSSSKDPDEQLRYEIANEFGIRLNDDVLPKYFGELK